MALVGVGLGEQEHGKIQEGNVEVVQLRREGLEKAHSNSKASESNQAEALATASLSQKSEERAARDRIPSQCKAQGPENRTNGPLDGFFRPAADANRPESPPYNDSQDVGHPQSEDARRKDKRMDRPKPKGRREAD